jgi:hypothetical protein
MKLSKLIITALVSRRVKLTPEVLEVLKRHHHDDPETENEDSPGDQAPARPKPKDHSTPIAPPASCGRVRLVFVSPLPGRWIRCGGIALGCGALWLAHPMSARGQESDFDAANRACTEGKWAEAARGYESVIARHGYSAPALFNLANAQFHEAKLGPAILNYERARGVRVDRAR